MTRLLMTLGSALLLPSCATYGSGAPPQCTHSNEVPNAWYVGEYIGVENVIHAGDFARDSYCAEQFRVRRHPGGFVTVFGGSGIKEHNTGPVPAINAANDRVYVQVRQFAHDWTQRYGNFYPILTGAGPGLMEAASRGAVEVGQSIGYTTYYDSSSNPTPERPHGGNPGDAFWKYEKRPLITDGLIFSSITEREAAMIRHSAAIIIAPSGTGTEWELFEVLETIKSKQLLKVPIYVVGERAVYWRSFEDRVNDMVTHGTLKPGEGTSSIEFVDDASQVVEPLRVRLGLK